MIISVVMIHYGKVSTTEDCLRKLSKKLGEHKLVLINNTADDLSSLSRIVPKIHIINNGQNLGFAKAVNQGVKYSMKDKQVSYVFLMNNDLSLSFGNLDLLLRTFRDKKEAGIVSPVLHHSGSLYDWGGKYSRFTALVKHRNFPTRPKTLLSVEHVAGAAMLISRTVIEKVGYLDERFFLYYEDLDFCLRVRDAGYQIYINPEVVAEHIGSAGSRLSWRTIRQWRSHFTFVLKYMPQKAYPTAILVDLLYYPLIYLKSLFLGTSNGN